MRTKPVATIAVAGLVLVGIATPSKAENFVATFSDMSNAKFTVKAIASRDVIREYAVCKAVWFAEKKKAQKMSLSDPVFDESPKAPPGLTMRVSDGWVAVTATAYLTDPNPSGNPLFSVAEKAALCRSGWDWYR
jgi:hypothetical protein